MPQAALELDRMLLALADPGRRGMVEQLSRGPASVKDLARPANMRLPSAVKHLRVLEDAGFIERGRDAQRRPRKLVAIALKDVADWLEPFRRQWEGRFDNLDRHLARMSKKEKQHGASSRRHQGRG